jgi:hypothetical protein
MGIQFERLTYASHFSLTQIVEDTAYLRRDGYVRLQAGGVDLEGWINAVQRQNAPLVQSDARQADLEAWLAAAEAAAAPGP